MSDSQEAKPKRLTARLAKARERWYVRWPMDLALVAVAVWAVSAWQARDVLSDAPAPDWTLTDLDGNQHTLSSYRGKRVLLVFWAPWCGVCKMESDNVSYVHEATSDDDDLAVLSVAVGYRDVDSVRAYVADQGATYPVLLGSSELTDQYGVSAYPTHLVIDEDGRIEEASVGYTTRLSMYLRPWM